MTENSTIKKTLFTSPYYVMVALMLGVFMMGLDSYVFMPALVPLVKDLNTTFSMAAWVTVAYMLFSTAIYPIAGKLSDVLGRKKVFLVGIGLFTLGSVLSSLSWNIEALIAFRAVQAIGGGIIMPTALATIAGIAPRDQIGKLMGLGGMVMGLAMILGPNIGGFIVQNFGWRSVFYINIPIGILVIIMTLMFRESYGDQKQHIDVIGSMLLITGLGAMLLGLNQLGSHPLTDITVFPLLVVALLLGVVLYWYEKRTTAPILDMSLISRGDFLSLNLAFMLVFFGLVFVVGFAAAFAQIVLGMGVQDSGTMLTPMSVGMFVMSFIGGVLLDKIGYRPMLLAGMFILVAGLAGMAFFVNDSLSLALDLVVCGVGMGISMSTFQTTLVYITSDKEKGVSQGIMGMFRGVGGLIAPIVGGFILNEAMQGTITYAQAFKYVFIAGILALLVATVLILYFNVRSKKTAVLAAPKAIHH
jgi:EmrB/QacA subfamily drug resistance transporter